MSSSKSGGSLGPFNSIAEAAESVQTVDWMLLVLLFFAFLGGYHVHFMLTAGEWDFWVDWKDRRMWPTVVPILSLTFCAASQTFWWWNFRLPFGAVFAALGLLIGEWINRYVNFWGWSYFPINLVFPSALIVPAIWLDVILLLSGSYVITAIVGALGWGLLFYPNNWPAIAAFRQATEQHGQLMSLADLIAFHYVRTSMPEYIRMVERGTLRTFGKDVVPVAAFFSGFVSMLVYFLWWFMGRWYSTTKVIDNEWVFAGGTSPTCSKDSAVNEELRHRNITSFDDKKELKKREAETAGNQLVEKKCEEEERKEPPSDKMDLAKAKKQMPQRELNAWRNEAAPKAGKAFKIFVNIGEQKEPFAASAPFHEPRWGDADFIELLVSLSSRDCEIDPAWHKLRLPRFGNSEMVVFNVVATKKGEHRFYVRACLAKQMIELQELAFVLAIGGAEAMSLESVR